MSNVTSLAIDDEAFLVASLIDRCPRTMMLRELVQNAIEAAIQASGPREVQIGTADIDGTRKLRILNTGPGMDAEALYKMCDLSSSIGKVKGLDGNFGMGAKVASLPSNHLGVRYRSCAAGRVNEVIMGKREGVYGRILRAPTGRTLRPGAQRLVDVLDVTKLAAEEGMPLDHDWTEVVLMGMEPEQDTASDPYHGTPAMAPFWLPEALYHRYFNLPSEVELIIDPALHWLGEPRRFMPLMQRAKTDFAGYEAVNCGDGITIHYLHDPVHPERRWENRSSEGAMQSSASLNAVVWRDELYEVQQGSPWFYEAPSFGLTFGGRNISVLIELADDYPVLPDSYRQFLRYIGEEQRQVRTRDFATLVRRNMPGWVRAIANKGDDARLLTASITTELGQLADLLGLTQLGEAPVAGDEPIETEDGQPAEADAFAGTKRACGIEPVMLRDTADVRDRWLEGRAAVFYPDTKQLFINMTYESLLRFQARLSDAAFELGEPRTIAAEVREISEMFFVRKLMRAVLFAIAKNLNPVNWQEGHVDKAMSPEALSIVGDDFQDLLPAALIALEKRVAEVKAAAEAAKSIPVQTNAVSTVDAAAKPTKAKVARAKRKRPTKAA